MESPHPEISPAQVHAELQASHCGRARGVHAVAFVAALLGVDRPTEFHLRSFRRAVKQLRLAGVPICGKPETGYFYAAHPDEITETVAWLYSRAHSTFAQCAALRQIELPDFATQLKIPPPE